MSYKYRMLYDLTYIQGSLICVECRIHSKNMEEEATSLGEISCRVMCIYICPKSVRHLHTHTHTE